MESVPFSIGKVYGGFVKCRGIIRVDGDCLYIELEMRDGLFGFLSSGIRAFEIPLDELESVTFKRGIFRGGTLRICAVRLGTLVRIPGQKDSEVKLKVARRHRSKAKLLASNANLGTIELRLEGLRGRVPTSTTTQTQQTPQIPAPEPPATSRPRPVPEEWQSDGS